MASDSSSVSWPGYHTFLSGHIKYNREGWRKRTNEQTWTWVSSTLRCRLPLSIFLCQLNLSLLWDLPFLLHLWFRQRSHPHFFVWVSRQNRQRDRLTGARTHTHTHTNAQHKGRILSHHPLVDSYKILLPHLGIKLGVMKNFVKAIGRGGRGSALLEKFPQKDMNKLHASIFDVSERRELVKN